MARNATFSIFCLFVQKSFKIKIVFKNCQLKFYQLLKYLLTISYVSYFIKLRRKWNWAKNRNNSFIFHIYCTCILLQSLTWSLVLVWFYFERGEKRIRFNDQLVNGKRSLVLQITLSGEEQKVKFSGWLKLRNLFPEGEFFQIKQLCVFTWQARWCLMKNLKIKLKKFRNKV